MLLFCGVSNSAEAQVFKLVSIADAPFGFTNKSGEAVGISVEIGNLIFKEADLPVENIMVPYALGIAMIESGEADFMIALPNSKLEAAARPIALMASFDIIIIGAAGTAFSNLADLRGKTVAAIRGAAYTKDFEEDTSIIHHRVNDYEQGLNMLKAGRLDALVGMRTGIFFQHQAMGGTRRELGEPLILDAKDTVLFFSSRRYNSEVAAKLKEATAELISRGVLTRILAKYFGDVKTQPLH